MIIYVPDIWMKHPENKKKIEALVAEYRAINKTDMFQSRADELDCRKKTLAIVQQLYEMGETEIAAYLRP